MLGKLYKLINTSNNKVYIGITYRSLEVRFKQHINDSKQGYNRPICKAISEIGSNNFSIVLLGEYPEGELEEAEIANINLYDSFNNGYNATLGGLGGKLIEHSREEIVQAYKQLLNASEVARLFDISKHTVLDIIKSHTTMEITNPLVKRVEFENLVFNGAGDCAQYLIDNKILSGNRADLAHNINRVARGARNSYKGLKFKYSSVV